MKKSMELKNLPQSQKLEVINPATSSIPANESWLHEPSVKEKLEKALAWAVNNSAKESNLDNFSSL